MINQIKTDGKTSQVKENLLLQCKKDFIKTHKNLYYIKEEIRRENEEAERLIKFAKEEYKKQLDRAKAIKERAKTKLSKRKEEIKNLDEAYDNYIEHTIDAWGKDRFNYIIETEEEYNAREKKKEEDREKFFKELMEKKNDK